MKILKDLIDLGYSPTSSLAIAAVIFLWLRQEYKERKQKVIREEWHNETRRRLSGMQIRIEELQEHIDDCNRDRQALNVEVAVLKTLTARVSRCPVPECPIKD